MLLAHYAVLPWSYNQTKGGMTSSRVKPPAGPLWSVTDDDRQRQTPATVTSLAPYTMCEWTSNKRVRS